MVLDSCATQKTGVMGQCAAILTGWWFVAVVVALLSCASPSPLAAYDIAILKSSDIAAYNQAVSGLQAELGDTATLTVYDLEGDVTRGKKLARKIRASDTVLTIAVGLKAALAAKVEIVDTPVIYCMVLDPEKYDLRAPNLTGISLRVPIERQFNTIHALVPTLKHLGVLYDSEKTAALVEEARRIAARLGLELIEHKVRSEKELPAAIRTLLPKVEGLWLVPDSTVLTEESIRFVLGVALDRNVPVIGFSSEFVRNGALASLSIQPEDIGRQAAIIAQKILKQSERPVLIVAPDRIRLSVNLKTAKYLGLTLPPDIIKRADEVY
ncbi:MAG: ABC transporter substrate-binding protein [Nitrospirales bacterium]|nr:ABC transporter substrate-binding protein [Nitrospirales bacterium]